jgi:hypothetical protein
MTETNHAKDQARAQLDNIVKLIADLTDAEESRSWSDYDAATEAIQDDALEIQVRSGWTNLGEKLKREEFYILLCTGGPAVRILGSFDRFNSLTDCKLQYQDWGTGWINFYDTTTEEDDAIEQYCSHFFPG